MSCVAVLAFAQTPLQRDQVNVTADRINRAGAVRHLVGHVVMENAAFTLQAEEVNYNDNTGEIVTQGETRITMKK